MKIKGLEITISHWDFVESLSEEEKTDLIDALSCEDDIIKNVTDQIVHLTTDNGSHGSVTSKASPSTPLSLATQEIAKNSSKIATREIKGLKREVKLARESAQEAWDKYHKLQSEIRGY